MRSSRPRPTGVVPVTCSAAILPRGWVATAAHCLQNIFAGQLFIYYGDNFAADLSQLVDGPNGLEAPAPGQPSFWAKADSFESHPNYDPAQHFPDIGFVYLDRKLPFDPLPLSRTSVAANRQVTISGWATTSRPRQRRAPVLNVQRTGTSRTLGSPTAADFHPEDPNPGLLVAANRAAQIKLDGTPPNANTCFGDSGSPLLITDSGQTYIAGVNYFTGLSCASYSLYTRISSFLPFFDEGYKKGGQESLKPVFNCVAPNAQGSLTAFFGYENKNGVSVSVPYGTKNSLPNDTTNQRLTRFLPGTHQFSFGVDFASNQSITWKLTPDNNPTTTLTVNQSSRSLRSGRKPISPSVRWLVAPANGRAARACRRSKTAWASVSTRASPNATPGPRARRETRTSMCAPLAFRPTPRTGNASTPSAHSRSDRARHSSTR